MGDVDYSIHNCSGSGALTIAMAIREKNSYDGKQM